MASAPAAPVAAITERSGNADPFQERALLLFYSCLSGPRTLPKPDSTLGVKPRQLVDVALGVVEAESAESAESARHCTDRAASRAELRAGNRMLMSRLMMLMGVWTN